MNKILLSTAYFPPINYFSAIAKADIINIEAFENYQKQSYRSRAYIAAPNGIQMLNVPVVQVNGNHTVITDIVFSKQMNWKNQHWNSILTAYNSSPFLLYYIDEIKSVFFEKEDSLFNFNNSILKLMMSLIGIKKEINFTSSYETNDLHSLDLRNNIHPKNIFDQVLNQQKYIQVFDSRYGFSPNLSILDLLFNLGPEAINYLNQTT